MTLLAAAFFATALLITSAGSGSGSTYLVLVLFVAGQSPCHMVAG